MSESYRLKGPMTRPAGKYILHPLDGVGGMKGRASWLADNLASSYSHQAGGYVLSPKAAQDFKSLFAAGFTGCMRWSGHAPAFNHNERPCADRLTRREALRLAAQWAIEAAP